jgi:hypothetical protein
MLVVFVLLLLELREHSFESVFAKVSLQFYMEAHNNVK